MLKQLPDGRFVCPISGFLFLMDEDGRNIGEFKAVQDSTFKQEFYDQLSFITKNETVLSTILNPGNQVDITKDLIIDSKDSVIVILMGEYDFSNSNNGRFDYGWIEDLEGNKVWSPWDEDTTYADYAGGSKDNRLTVQKILLEKGNYKIRFVSDGYHSYEQWSLVPPDFEEFWGISVYENKLKTKINREKERSESDFKWNPIDIEINSDGTMWMSNRSGIVLFDFDKGVIGRYKTKYARGLSTIIKDPYNDNYLWSLGNDDAPGLCRFNRSTGMFKYYDLDPDKTDNFVFEPNGLEFMNENEIWLRSSNRGILRFNPQTGKATRLVMDRANGNALRDNRINFLYRDKAGAMWVSTSTMGISIYDPYYQKFGLIPYKQGLIKNSFPSPNISNMGLHPNGSIIFNNGRSYFIFDPNKKELNKENLDFLKNIQMATFIHLVT